MNAFTETFATAVDAAIAHDCLRAGLASLYPDRDVVALRLAMNYARRTHAQADAMLADCPALTVQRCAVTGLATALVGTTSMGGTISVALDHAPGDTHPTHILILRTEVTPGGTPMHTPVYIRMGQTMRKALA